MDLSGKIIALLATDGFEDSELMKPKQVISDVGGKIIVVSNKTGEIVGEKGTPIEVDKLVNEVQANDFDGLLIPGGVKNPDTLRTDKLAVNLVETFFAQHKPVASICHGPWLLVEAGVLEKRTVTSWPSLKTDIINAGGHWVDKEVVVDQGLVTSRNPGDLDAFCAKAVEEFSEGKHKKQTT